MVQLFSDLKVQQDSQAGNPGCDDAQSYCGLRNGRYPDRRAMGFPFDRQPRQGVNTLQQFLTGNMFVLNTVIRYTNRVVAGTPTGNRGSSQNQSGTRPSNQPSGNQTGGRPNTNTSNTRPNNPRSLV